MMSAQCLLAFMLSEQALAAGVVAFANIPLLTRVSGATKANGVLLVNFTHPYHFNEPLLSLLTVFAELAATVIENAKLHQSVVSEQTRLMNETEDLRRISQNLERRANLDAVVEEIIAQLQRLPCLESILQNAESHISIQLLENDHRIQIGGKGLAGAGLPSSVNIPVSRDSLIGPIVESRAPTIVPNAANHLILRQGKLATSGAWLGIPLVHAKEVVGPHNN
jgi:GAF domain-containing protein